MSEPSPNSPLRQKALDYLSQQYLKVCTQPLDPEQVEFRIEPGILPSTHRQPCLHAEQ